jgi:tetratricopeptide (TPR) repeat protein
MNNAHEAACAQMYAAGLHAAMREFERAEALASQALTLSEQHQLAYQAAFSRCVLGQAKTRLGQAAEGIPLLRRGITGSLQIGMPLRTTYYTALLAEAEQQQGASADALETIERAFRAEPDAPVFRPEIVRIRGELRVSTGQKDRAEADFREAIGLARSMGAKAWELRSALSLARLLAQRGRSDEARSMLAEIYAWFTDGFDTADLKDAKALLHELSD